MVLLNKCDSGLCRCTVRRLRSRRISNSAGQRGDREGIEELKPLIAGKLSAFTGNSGVGKSSILNAWIRRFSSRWGM